MTFFYWLRCKGRNCCAQQFISCPYCFFTGCAVKVAIAVHCSSFLALSWLVTASRSAQWAAASLWWALWSGWTPCVPSSGQTPACLSPFPTRLVLSLLKTRSNVRTGSCMPITTSNKVGAVYPQQSLQEMLANLPGNPCVPLSGQTPVCLSPVPTRLVLSLLNKACRCSGACQKTLCFSQQ